MRKYFIRLLLPLLVFGAACTGSAQQDYNHDQILENLLGQILESGHYSRQQINDEFSRKAFSLYLKRIDINKMYLLQSDVDQLKKYELGIDEQMKELRTDLYKEASSMLAKRQDEAKEYYQDILSKPFDFSVRESFETDPDKRSFSRNRDELKEYWRKYLKYMTLSRYMSDLEKQEKAVKADSKSAVKSKTEIEADARKYVMDVMKKRLDKKTGPDDEDRFAQYINAISNAFEPHTEYFPPQEKENFDLGITGTLEGIGAQLQEDNGHIKVESIVPGSASWRQGELKAGDVILKVAQGNDMPHDVVDVPIKEAIKLIRGPKGTEVRLTIQKPDGSSKVIPIIRDVVVIEETYAKSAIFNNEQTGRKIGYIFLPKFYFSNETEGRKASEDVRHEIETLRAQNVDGIVLDLRYNGGGSLQEAVDMSGLFIDQGPVVQVKNKNGQTQVLSDRNPGTAYDGLLLVMVNSYSASASEILTGALKDYKRAVIVGSPSTFGKGSVQTFVDLDSYLPPEIPKMKSLGALKLTIQQYYRVNGSSTQFVGVVPDIVLPDVYVSDDDGEKSLEYAMPWDSINSLNYKIWDKAHYDGAELRKLSEKRIASNKVFSLIKEKVDVLKNEKDKTAVPLSEEETRAKSEERKQTEKAFTELKQELPYIKVMSNQKPGSDDKASEEKKKEWEKQLREDIYIQEAMNIMGDMISQNLAKK